MDGLAVLSWGLNACGWFFIAYSVLINTSFLVLTLLAVADFWAYLRRVDFAAYDETFSEPLTPGISILMPAYNESAGIVESVQAMTALRYPDFEVVVIDDGSKDDTSEQLIAAFDMVEVPIVVPTDIATKGHVTATYLSRRGANNVLLVRKTNGGKADALNVGERPGHVQQRGGVEQRVGVDHAHQLLAGRVDADVEGVRLAAVGLAHQQHVVRAAAREVRRGDVPLRDDVGRHHDRHLDHVEGGDQLLGRVVLRAVVDHHHFEVRVAQRGHRLHRLDDAGALVVGRHQDRDARRQRL